MIRGLDDMVRYINQTLVNQPIVDVLRTLSGDLPLKMERNNFCNLCCAFFATVLGDGFFYPP